MYVVGIPESGICSVGILSGWEFGEVATGTTFQCKSLVHIVHGSDEYGHQDGLLQWCQPAQHEETDEHCSNHR